NHVNIRTDKGIKKHTIPHFPEIKKSVSQIDIDSEVTKDWLTHIFLELEESTHSKIIYGELLNILKKYKNYVDFFTRLFHKLYPEAGLIIANSANESLRVIENEYFIKLNEHR